MPSGSRGAYVPSSSGRVARRVPCGRGREREAWPNDASTGRGLSRETSEATLEDHITRMVRIARPMTNEGIHAHPGRVRLSWPARGRLTQGYGCTGFRLEPRRGHCRHFHYGIDIAADRNAPIRAAATGVVAYVGWDPWDHGHRSFIVILVHRGGSETLYGHLRPRRLVAAGEVARRGDVIGSMGDTGRSTGVHLYFAISRGFRVVDPLGVLPPAR